MPNPLQQLLASMPYPDPNAGYPTPTLDLPGTPETDPSTYRGLKAPRRPDAAGNPVDLTYDPAGKSWNMPGGGPVTLPIPEWLHFNRQVEGAPGSAPGGYNPVQDIKGYDPVRGSYTAASGYGSTQPSNEAIYNQKGVEQAAEREAIKVGALKTQADAVKAQVGLETDPAYQIRKAAQEAIARNEGLANNPLFMEAAGYPLTPAQRVTKKFPPAPGKAVDPDKLLTEAGASGKVLSPEMQADLRSVIPNVDKRIAGQPTTLSEHFDGAPGLVGFARQILGYTGDRRKIEHGVRKAYGVVPPPAPALNVGVPAPPAKQFVPPLGLMENMDQFFRNNNSR